LPAGTFEKAAPESVRKAGTFARGPKKKERVHAARDEMFDKALETGFVKFGPCE
jgi:hypothetical protein